MPFLSSFGNGSLRSFGLDVRKRRRFPDKIDYLIIAGGGGGESQGGSATGAGGGGGGVIQGTQFAIAPGTPYSITVGGGGSAGARGSNTAFGPLNAVGGGAGGSSAGPAQNGGSGGGGTFNNTPGPAFSTFGLGIPGQGTNGGRSFFSTNYGGSGGGGATANGVNADQPVQTGGYGVGLFSSISGANVEYSWGGQNGRGTPQAFVGHGGSGTFGGPGTPGSSGVLIIRYPDYFDRLDAAAQTGSPQVVTTGGYHIYTFTGSGSVVFSQ